MVSVTGGRGGTRTVSAGAGAAGPAGTWSVSGGPPVPAFGRGKGTGAVVSGDGTRGSGAVGFGGAGFGAAGFRAAAGGCAGGSTPPRSG
ncbi:MAG TPA: hypothetical protein VHG51_18025, partial [Longimicrobiaceae bacterium]|nr:hypothetical protein [Longimicrobiaceae bacterium]